MDKDRRRHLGYHVTPGDRTVDLYGRDTMAAPLRALVEVMSDIKNGKFDPDATRSGAFRPASSSTPAAPPSSPSASTSDSGDVHDLDFEPMVVINVATGMLHMSSEDSEKLACGKVLPLNHKFLRELPAGPRCPRCFGALPAACQ